MYLVALVLFISTFWDEFSHSVRFHPKIPELFGHQLAEHLNDEVEFMDRLTGYEFEDYTAWLLKLNGFSAVQQTDKNNDNGFDVLAMRHNNWYGFQCKHYRNRLINRRVVKHTSDAGHYYGTDYSVIITNADFDRVAKRDQQFFHVIFWDRQVLIKLIRNAINATYEADWL